jgi:hypothetical protein
MVLVRYSFFKNIFWVKTVPHSGTRIWVLCQFQKLDPVSVWFPTIQNWRFLVLTPQRRYLPNIDLNLLFDKGYTGDFHSHLVSLEAPTDQDQSFLIREIISQREGQ